MLTFVSPQLRGGLFLFLLAAALGPAAAEGMDVTESSPTYAPTAARSAPQQHLQSQPKSQEIEALWNQGKISQANRLLDNWMSQDKEQPWPWVQAASLSYRSKKYNRSLSYLKKALDKSPNCADAYFWRGKSYEAMNKPLEAANEYRAALMAQDSFREAQEGLDRVSALLGS